LLGGAESCTELAIAHRSYAGEERERERRAPRLLIREARRPQASSIRFG
jgi:hypothetical protein